MAVPAIIQYMLHTLQFLADTKMVSASVGEDDLSLAALNLVSPLCWSLTTVFTVTAIGATAIVARRIGENQRLEAATATSTALVLALALGTLVTLLGWVAREGGIDWLEGQVAAGQAVSAEQIADLADGYLKWFVLLFPIRALAVTLEATLRGAGSSLLPLIGGVLANVANIVGNAVLLFGLWGAPKMGLEGVGLATGLAPLVEVVLILAVILTNRRLRLSLRIPGALRFDMEQARETIRLSTPALGAALLFHSGFVVYQFAILKLDASSMAAHRVAIAIQSMAFLPAQGFQSAAASVCGRLLGAGHADDAYRSAWRSCALGVATVIPVAALLLFGSHFLTGIFGVRPETAALAASCLMIGALEVPFLMVTESLTGTLRGAGDNLPVMWITAIGSWGFRVPFAWVLAFGYYGFPALGLQGIWVATVLDWIVRSLLCAYVVRRRRWMTTSV
ncbi:MAG: MATE family efflux transporter [Planctomycetota bacterium]|nr:MATE family efflux transporter [Planctomycetota bacterium]